MRTAGYRVALLLAAVLASGSALLTAGAVGAQQQAITATVPGEKIQKVGFRAMIQKEAIMYNLAGFARNNPDGTVDVSLQGDKGRIDRTSPLFAPAARNLHRTIPSARSHRVGSRSEVVHSLRLDIDQPEYHPPL